MYSKTCPIPVKNVRDKLIEMTPLSSLLSDCIQDTIQVDEVWHNLCSELTSILAMQKQPTNRPQLNKSDRPQVNIWDTWKTWKYLNINDSIHFKNLEISKYKRESKARMPKKMC